MSQDNILSAENCGRIRGRRVYYDYDAEKYFYADNDEPAENWGGEARPCPECGELPTEEGYDACLGHIPGAVAACCGHGVEEGTIVWEEDDE